MNITLTILLYEGLLASTKPAADIAILRSPQKETATLYYMVTLTSGFIVIPILTLLDIFTTSQSVAALLLLICKSIYVLNAKIYIAKGNVHESFKLVFLTDTIPLSIAAAIVAAGVADAYVIITVYALCSLIIGTKLVGDTFRVALVGFLNVRKSLLQMLYTSPYAFAFAYWYPLERSILVNLNITLEDAAFTLLCLRLSSFAFNLLFGYFSASQYWRIARFDAPDCVILLRQAVAYCVFITFSGVLLIFLLPIGLFEFLFPRYILYIEKNILYLALFYTAIFNYLLFLVPFLEKKGKIVSLNLLGIFLLSCLWVLSLIRLEKELFFSFLLFLLLLGIFATYHKILRSVKVAEDNDQ